VTTLESKAIGCLAGAAIGDALGGATEGWRPDQIQARYGGWVTDIVPPYFADPRDAPPNSPYRKGMGRVTDDTLMVLALVDVYRQRRDHLGAYDIAELMVPALMTERRWIPDLEREDILLQRIFLAEKWLVARLHYGHVDPREAGTGNLVNCGAAMYMAPVGIANAADPLRAYDEAIDIAGAHQSSFGREAAGVAAACVAAAMAPEGTLEGVIEAALAVARDGTRAALEAVVAAARLMTGGGWRDALAPLREAIAPFDSVGDDYREPDLGARRPSRLHAIEELPIALGLLLVTGGDYREAVLGAANYGRDADSIATMAGGIAGALSAGGGIPADWYECVSKASRLDLQEPGRTMAAVATEIDRRDRDRADARARSFDRLILG
jgi:ADP-ribosylglycohydrolase